MLSTSSTKTLLCLLLVLAAPAGRARADDAAETSYWRLLDFPVRAVTDVPEFFQAIDPRDHWRAYTGVAASTVAFWYYDQKLLDGSQQFARHVGLISADNDGRQTSTLSKQKIFGIGANLNFPTTPNSAMYYLGDGLTSFVIAGGLATYSLIATDSRALSTAAQMLEAITLAGCFVLPLKMSTGRESPFRRSEERGRWSGFVGFRNYLRDVSKHDAYPSGHIATAMATVRILAENYLEMTWILPVGYTAMGLLMFAMLNNGEHWASDYPLGIAIGYTAAGVVSGHHKPQPAPGPAAGGEGSAASGLSLIRGDAGGVGVQKTWSF